MPRLPVGRAVAMALLIAMALPAQAAVIVHSVDDLRKDKDVIALDGQFQTVSAATVAYDQCGTAYGVTPEDNAYLQQLFTRTGQRYAQSYTDAYITLVGAPPTQSNVDASTDYIRGQQQAMVNRTDAFIKQRGCHNLVVRNLFKSIDTIHKSEEAATSTPADPRSK